MRRPRIALLCATRRGLRFLKHLRDLVPEGRITVFSFRGDPWEPPFLDGIRELALRSGCRFFEARQVGSPDLAGSWQEPVDVLLAVSWRFMVPRGVYGRARLGAYVFHDSYLPAYRGFSPTVWAMLRGEDSTGVTLLQMTDGVDAGPIIDQERVPIGGDEVIETVMERVTETYLRILERNAPGLFTSKLEGRPQDEAAATYTCRRLPEDNRIDWRSADCEILNLVRASSKPYPGAFTTISGRRLTVWKASGPREERRWLGAVPGRVVEVRSDGGVVVLAGTGSVCLRRVQLDDGAERAAADILHSTKLTLGS